MPDEPSTSSSVRIYERSSSGCALVQCEIISGIVQHLIEALPDGQYRVRPRTHSYALVLTQSCDLERDHSARTANNGKPLSDILYCPAYEAAEGRAAIGPGSEKWKRVQTNQEERWQFLELVVPDDDALGLGVPELVLDFRQLVSIPSDELQRQLQATAARRARLLSPFLEQVADRLFGYHARVALPLPHRSAP